MTVRTRQPLTPEEAQQLAEFEKILNASSLSYIEIGHALRVIRDQRLFRATDQSFSRYCDMRFGYKHAYSYGLIQAAVVAETVCNCGQFPPPSNEAQARELAKLSSSTAQIDVWSELLAAHPRETLSAALVAEAVAAHLPTPAPALPSVLQRITPEINDLAWRWDPLVSSTTASGVVWHVVDHAEDDFLQDSPDKVVFVCPTVDFLNSSIPQECRAQLLDIMNRYPAWTFLVWTRQYQSYTSLNWESHIHAGVRITNEDDNSRWDNLHSLTAYERVNWVWYMPGERYDFPARVWNRVVLGNWLQAWEPQGRRAFRRAMAKALAGTSVQIHLQSAWVPQILGG